MSLGRSGVSIVRVEKKNLCLTQPMDPEKKGLNGLFFPTQEGNPKKFKVWPLAE